jgi:hypothetical protein
MLSLATQQILNVYYSNGNLGSWMKNDNIDDTQIVLSHPLQHIAGTHSLLDLP